MKRSLENAKSQPAVEYYFSQDPPAGSTPPAWPLDRLFAWLHAVLQNVVREERDRVAYGREVSISVIGSGRPDGNDRLDPADPAPDQLDALLQSELRRIVLDCLPMLDREYQSVLKMRMHGLKYGEIAIRLGVSENTVATWVSRGIRELARCVRGRTERLASLPRGAGP
ncbi:MAG: RNA polymerase sigma factor [Acidobacteria bacterium]|nr:RNA polymerase sigma factor [Acidobacteriota bacterium]